jgi:magnesium transporter
MTIPQLVGLFSVLPHDDVEELMALLSKEQADRVRDIMSEREVTARDIMSANFLTVYRNDRAGDVLEKIRHSAQEPESISYVYVVNGDGKTLLGVVDLRDLVLAANHMALGEIMISPVVTAEEDDLQEDVAEMFAKYHYRLIPVVDGQDRILGVINYNDIMKGVVTRAKL